MSRFYADCEGKAPVSVFAVSHRNMKKWSGRLGIRDGKFFDLKL